MSVWQLEASTDPTKKARMIGTYMYSVYSIYGWREAALVPVS